MNEINNEQTPHFSPETEENEKKRSRRINLILTLFFIFSLILLAIAYKIYSVHHSQRLLSSINTFSMVYPWDPLDWYDLKKTPLIYKNLGSDLDDYSIYTPYLEDREKPVTPIDANYFQKALSLIRYQYVQKVSDKDLKAGIRKELEILYKDAKAEKTPPDVMEMELDRKFFNNVMDEKDPAVDGGLVALAMVQGLFRGLNDPYSYMLTPEDYSSFMEKLQEKSFGGIGVYLELNIANDNMLTVVEPVEGTPAALAGLQSGDIIMAIDGKPTKNTAMSINMSRIRGPKGSTVHLQIKRDGKLMDFKIVRDDIKVSSISHKILDGGIGYIKIKTFGMETVDEFDKAVADLIKPSNNLQGLIVDVRNNGGGLLDAGIDLSSRFMTPDKVVFRKIDRNDRVENFYAVKSYNIDLPAVLLINRFSASSSEIMAGALKENSNVTLVGERTFGKGSVQQLVNIPDGSAIKLTVSYFLTPTGRIINKRGLMPDWVKTMKADQVGKKDDVQLKAAEEILAGMIEKEKNAPRSNQGEKLP